MTTEPEATHAEDGEDANGAEGADDAEVAEVAEDRDADGEDQEVQERHEDPEQDEQDEQDEQAAHEEGEHEPATVPPVEPAEPAEPVRLPPARFSLHRRVRVVFTVTVVLALLLTAAGTAAFVGLIDARDALVDRADPGLRASSDLLAALVDQETGVRAYVLSTDETFLEPYERGAAAADDARADLDRLAADLPGVEAQLDEVDRSIAAWRADYAEPTIEQARAGDPAVREDGSLREGRALFDGARAQVADLQDLLTTAREDARDRLDTRTVRLLAILALTALIVAAMAGLLWRLVRRGVEAPLLQLSGDARQVAGGDLGHLVEPVGPRELQALAVSMEQMRQRIVDELAAVSRARDALAHQAGDLERSNLELEQFAYVASHDLQEPLRKVASFCQLLQSRYAGRLDERADQYIGFAVDGAKRMQALINDLLAFSRVGRSPADAVVVRAGQLVDQALENLSEAIEESDARITVVGPLPRVRMETSLGVALFQNLISNGLKFRRPDAPPRVHVTARRAAGFHEFTVHDEGIGIPAEYADRIFVIFQRLHARDDYGGTGIGLALCRKIVEGHGGRIWVDTDARAEGRSGPATGTTVRFTLPVVEGDA